MVMSKKFAHILSYVLSPNNISFYVILLFIFFSTENTTTGNLIPSILIAIIFLYIFPMVGIIYYTKKGKIDIWVSDRKTRTPFYLIALLGYCIAAYLFIYLQHHNFFVLSLAYIAVTIALTCSNFITKVSSHSAGLTGPVTAISYIFGMIALPLFLLLPLIFWARLKLNAHSFHQLLAGSLIGIIITLPVYLLFY